MLPCVKGWKIRSIDIRFSDGKDFHFDFGGQMAGGGIEDLLAALPSSPTDEARNQTLSEVKWLRFRTFKDSPGCVACGV